MKRAIRVCGVFTLVTGVLCAAAARAEDAVEFRYKIGPDDRLIYRSIVETSLTQTLGDADVDTTFSATDVGVRTLQEIDGDGNFRIQIENKGLKARASVGPLGEYTYDSKAADNDKGSALGGSLTPLYDTLRGAFVWITVTPRGEVLKVEGLKDLLEGVLKDNPLAAQFAAGGSEDGARLQYGDAFLPFPDRALRPGDTWETPFEAKLDNLGTLKGKRKFRYVGREEVDGRRLAKFTETQELTFDLDIDTPDARAAGTLSTTDSSGTIHFDPERGQVVSKTATVKLAGDYTIRAGDVTLEAHQEQTQTTTFELLDELPE